MEAGHTGLASAKSFFNAGVSDPFVAHGHQVFGSSC
jgi:hypothetical protein